MGDANDKLKELVNEAIHNHFNGKVESEMILKDWVHLMCEQAAKADKYEAKAKAFDEGLEAVHDRLQHILHNTDTGKLLPGYADGMHNSLDIINDCYESGEAELEIEEEEKMYVVEIKTTDSTLHLWRATDGSGDTDFILKDRVTTGQRYFTKKEIESIDGRFLQFANEVPE